MTKRPRITPELTTGDKWMEGAGWVLLLLLWILVAVNYASLPHTIPIHYNGLGQPNRFGGKSAILVLPLIATVLVGGLTILNRYPYLFNYPTKVTADNATWQYTRATKLVRYLKVAIVILFGVICWRTIEGAHSKTTGMGNWFLPFVSILIYGPVIYVLLTWNRKRPPSRKD